MGQSTRKILNQRKSKLIFAIIGALIISFTARGVIMASDSQASQILGSWKVYKDDDRPKGPIPKEIMNFWADGKFLIAGDHPNEGLYRINGNKLELLAKKGDRAIPIEMHFQLSTNELKFKNQKVGWVYYKRISKQPEGEEPDLK